MRSDFSMSDTLISVVDNSLFQRGLSILSLAAAVMQCWRFSGRRNHTSFLFLYALVVCIADFIHGIVITASVSSGNSPVDKSAGQTHKATAQLTQLDEAGIAMIIFLTQLGFAFQIYLGVSRRLMPASALVFVLAFVSFAATLAISSSGLETTGLYSNGLVAAMSGTVFPNLVVTIVLLPIISSVKLSGSFFPFAGVLRNFIVSGALVCLLQTVSLFGSILVPASKVSVFAFTLPFVGKMHILTMLTMFTFFADLSPSDLAPFLPSACLVTYDIAESLEEGKDSVA